MAGAATTRVPPSRVLLVASFGAFLAFLDATIVNVAFPSIRESFAGHDDRRAVVGPQRLQHRLRRVPHRLRPADRPPRPAPLLRRRGRGLHGRVGLCGHRPVRRAARRWPASCRRSARRCSCRRPWPSSSRPSRPSAGRTPSACGAPPRRWPPASARRSAARSSSSAAGAGRSSSTCRSASSPCGRARRQLVESRAPGRRTDARPRRRGAARRQPRRCSTSASSRAATGAGPARRCSARVAGARAGVGLFVVSSRRAPRAAARPDAAAAARPSGGRLGRDDRRRIRVLRVPADQHPVAAVRLGLRRAARRPGARPGCAWSPPSSPLALGPLGRPARLPRLRRARGARLGRRLRLVPPAGRPRACVLGRVAAGPGAQRHRRRGHAAAARQRRAGRGPRRPVRHGIRGRVQRAPARRRPRHRPARRHRSATRRRATAVARSGTDGCCRSSPSSSSPSWRRRSAGCGPHRRTRPSPTSARPSSTRPTPMPSGRSRPQGPATSPTSPSCRCSRCSRRRRASASSWPPRPVDLPAGEVLVARGRPAGVGLRRAHRPARGAPRRGGRPRARPRARCSASSPCSPVSRARPPSALGATPR